MSTRKRADRSPPAADDYPGLKRPTTFPVPDELVDRWAPLLSGAEIKVLLYICRRTLGFYQRQDAISYSQFVEGIVKRNGERLDAGAGVSNGSLGMALKHLEELGLIDVERRSDPEHGHVSNIYRLRWAPRDDLTAGDRPPTPKIGVGASPNFGVGLLQNLEIQETVLQETDAQETDDSNFRRVPNQKSASADLDRQTILTYVDDIAREMADQAKLKASTTRAYKLFRRSGLDLEAFVDAMLSARATVKERTAAIRSTTREPGRPFPTKRKMPYFFAVLEDRLGLKDASRNEERSTPVRARAGT